MGSPQRGDSAFDLPGGDGHGAAYDLEGHVEAEESARAAPFRARVATDYLAASQSCGP
jgi:hypothetical protein